jgi:PAS domain S-box-containing protein
VAELYEPKLGTRTSPPPSDEVEALRREIERLQALSRNERGLLEGIVNHSPHGILVCDRDGRMTLHNRAAEKIWAGSATAESVEDWSKYRAFHPDGRPYAASDWAMARCLARGEIIQPHEIDVQRFDGTRGVLLGSCAPIFSSTGEISGAFSVFADITSFKRLESELKAAHADTEVLYRLSEAMMYAQTVEEIHEHALDAISTGLAVDRASILEFDDAGVMRFRAWRGLSDTYRRAVDGHSPWSKDERAPTPILVSDMEQDAGMEPYRPVFRAEGIRGLGFFPLIHAERLLGKFMVYSAEPRAFSERDVRLARTVGTHVAQSVARRRDELRIAKAVASRDEILAIVSHDLRNQLNTLSLSSAVVGKAVEGATDKQQRAAQRIQRSVTTMNRLIADLVDMSAADAGVFQVHPSDTEVRPMIDQAVEQLRPLAEAKGQTLTVRSSDAPRAMADAERVVQVLVNVVGNAIKFTPEGGAIVLSARTTAQGARRFVEFEVVDSGPGIPAEHLPRIFDRFWRPPQSEKGVGLGLAVAKAIIETHGGTISAESPPGSGAVFRFCIPEA